MKYELKSLPKMPMMHNVFAQSKILSLSMIIIMGVLYDWNYRQYFNSPIDVQMPAYMIPSLVIRVACIKMADIWLEVSCEICYV